MYRFYLLQEFNKALMYFSLNQSFRFFMPSRESRHQRKTEQDILVLHVVEAHVVLEE